MKIGVSFRAKLLATSSCLALFLMPAMPNLPSDRVPPSRMHRHHAAIVMAFARAESPGASRQPLQNATPAAPSPGTSAEGGAPTPPTPGTTPQPGTGTSPSPAPAASGPSMARLSVRVVDGRTMRPLEGAEVVLIETEQRLTTGRDGYTPVFNAPVLRDPRYRPLVAELHGQLGVIVYKNGYRDSVHLGIRMHEGQESHTTVWMYRLGPGDQRIEPVLYEVPYHHLWLVELADRFRSKTQPGEGPERP